MKIFILSLILAFSVINQPGDNPKPGDKKFKKQFLESINRIRQRGCNCGTTYMPPVPPITWNDELEKAAKGHAVEIAKKHFFSHISKDGRTAMTRAENAGYNHKGFRSFTVGENIAQGQPTIDIVMAGWFKSEPHCMNLMNPDFKEVGVWVDDTYWVQDFGGREEFSTEMQRMIKSGKATIIQGKTAEHH
ncbi:CAP domain-containing protein [Mucilaginibacter sp. S1162]|uniref:CAP domain-containing protein n=1 Tax=Mucilaginibacter humi TaxID=2732510 RepID=A0ABX1W702_9SPHI|nr:CAP domain-containing protein [Mucilaginibacter humi]NNU34042.1 CAP domain-containing protein [Mucilaginibacter humi]